MCFLTKGRYIEISSGLGCLLPGGLQGTIFVIYIFDRFKEIKLSILSKSFPLCPTKGFPNLSSSAPGASPINITFDLALPSAKTKFLAVFLRSQPLNSLIAVRSSSRLFIDSRLSCFILFFGNWVLFILLDCFKFRIFCVLFVSVFF